MVSPPLTTIPFPLHGPISDWRIVIFVPLLIVMQSPFGFVMCRFSMVTLLWPDRVIGPEGVKPLLALLLTLTITEADAVFPAASYALAIMVWDPLLADAVFQLEVYGLAVSVTCRELSK